MSFFAFDSARLWREDRLDAVDASLIPNTRRLLWKFRHALTGEKKALPKFLLAVDWRDATEVSQVPALLKAWASIDVADAIKLLGPDQAYQRSVVSCVKINQCVGCTRQFFTKSFLGDDPAVLARSSCDEPASPRHRAGVASMAWRTTR